MESEVSRLIARFTAEYPLMQPSLLAQPEAQRWAGADFCRPEVVQEQISDCQDYFEMERCKDAAQLWLHATVGNLLAPLVQCSVVTGQFLSAAVCSADHVIFRNSKEEFWLGSEPAGLVATAAVQAHQIAESCSALISVAADVANKRPAPLWAVAIDALMAPLLSTGVQEFEVVTAMEMAQKIYDAVCAVAPVHIPPIPVVTWGSDNDAMLQNLAVFSDASGAASTQLKGSGAVEDAPPSVAAWLRELADAAWVDEPEFVAPLRASCCMIYQSPKAEICNACPKHPMESRRDALLRYAQSLEL